MIFVYDKPKLIHGMPSKKGRRAGSINGK